MKVPDSIEIRLFELKTQKGKKWVREEMNGEEIEKKKEEGIEICKTGENIFP